MRSSSIPRSLILVASAALTFGACGDSQVDPGVPGQTNSPSNVAGNTVPATGGTPAPGATGGAPGAGTAGAKPPAAGGSVAVPPTAGTLATGGAGMTAGAAGSPAGAAGTSAAGATGGAAGGAAAGGATFTKVYEEILTGTGCAVGVCHGSAMAASRLGLADKATSYADLVGVKAMGMQPAGSMGTGCMGMDVVRVKAGDPAASLLIQKLEGTQKCGNVMPPSGMLKPEQIKLVRDWITAGAKND